MDATFLSEFSNPSSQYRGAPFWAWNGKLEPGELRRQIRLMKQMGLGGFFMHSRIGLATEYMSEQWMQCVAACVDEAEKLDMQAWLYDEDRWPSGAAGGLVTKDPRYRQRRLHMLPIDKPSELRWTKNVLAAFIADFKDGQPRKVIRLPRGKKVAQLASGQRILSFEVRMQECSSAQNGYTTLDVLNHEAVREFIRVTHEAYKSRFGSALGKRIPGIFTDEPNPGGNVFFAKTGSAHGPWTDNLPQVFRQRYGYDILDHLVEIFHVVEGQTFSKFRRDFRDCLTHLFTEAFASQIGQWCEKAGCLHAGHVLLEGTLTSQTDVTGSCMRFYEHMQAPGMDVLTQYWREYDTAKQVSSAARQFGRRWRLSETYGCTGWDFPLAGHKAVGDWQAALGINLRCQHLAWYTMEGAAKRDYPASIFYHSPWWQVYPKVEDYFGRVHVAMSRGQEVRDILVIHPLESAWAVYCSGSESSQKQMDDDFWRLRDCLLGANLDFDYGDEDILARHASITTSGGKPLFHVGQAVYKVIIVPQMLTMRRSTLEMLTTFRNAGGTVIFAGDPSPHVDAQPSADASVLAAACIRTAKRGLGLIKAAEQHGRRVSIVDADGTEILQTLYCLREDKDSFYLFVCNTSDPNIGRHELDVSVSRRTLAFDDVRITLWAEGFGPITELDCETGRLFAADGQRQENYWSLRTTLPALGSRLFVFDKKDRNRNVLPCRSRLTTLRTRSLGGVKPWNIVLSEPNVLVFDRPRYRINGGKWQEPAEILKVDRQVRQVLQIEQRTGHMVQPWAQPAPANPKRAVVELEYEFVADAVPIGVLWMAIERPNSFCIRLNGSEANTDMADGWWVDPSLVKIPLDASAVKQGCNIISLVCDYNQMHPGLEIIYLLGAFGASVRGTDLRMKKMPVNLRVGDWGRQGLPFYSGSVCYCRKIATKLTPGERLFVQVPSYAGTAARVLVDGQTAGVIAWPPNEVEITSYLANSDSAITLGIEVIGHRRNSHGPFHLDNKQPIITGPNQYAAEGQWVHDIQLVPCGLMQPPQLVIRA